MRAEHIKDRVRMADLIAKLGIKVTGSGSKAPMFCPVHNDKHDASATFYRETDSWACHKCGIGGTVIDLAMQVKHLDFKAACEWLRSEFNLGEDDSFANKSPLKVVETYCYSDEYGVPVFYSERYENITSKSFKQYRIENGVKIYDVKGVRKVLYNLQAVIASEEVFVFEGERKAQRLIDIDKSYGATCNSGGSASWLESYAEFLKDKHVTICPDSDDAGKKWEKEVFESVKDRAKSVRIVKMPVGYNDINDLFVAMNQEFAVKVWLDCLSKVPRVVRGGDLPLLSASEMFEKYREEVCKPVPVSVDLSRWIPMWKSEIRPLVAGDLVAVLANTGVGKTAFVQNVALKCTKLPVIMFELELSDLQMTERTISVSDGIDARDVEARVRSGQRFDVSAWSHIWTSTLSRLDVPMMEDIINRAELKLDCRPAMVIIDYVGLIRGGSGKRYERMSTIAEDLKLMAKNTRTIVMMASQVRRPDGDKTEVSLHDGKDSGSIECSSSLVFGLSRPTQDTMTIKILKNTKGCSGYVVECDYFGSRYEIRQKKIQDMQETVRNEY
jgi:5S rRNA maturation endonuclease (ribonuclease M5)/KaiC/GvpD/RAD55 family RecA-like ATPase